ncbi:MULTISPECIES: hypothetical protein [Pseudoxanthomonas]|uniref:hypothetical protein n=1 Tax=Pseudoxanthomonas TaxID=83618 RepID=UPI001391D0DE|nr:MULTISPECIES: hypothetical protein [Pseudoxanthomonas]KAF1698606.1 hypothetical protein CSC62_05120 [Pseudoxanthomonas jiangsuensis]MCR6686372.1 hypothetical protein [Pseudoxanthomonas sp.]
MKQRLTSPWSLSALALALALAAPGAFAQAAAEATTLRQQMSAEEFKAAGLDKLTAQELAALQAWIRRGQEGAAVAAATEAAPAESATVLSAAEIERIREQAREEGRQQVKQENRGFFDFGTSEPIASTLVGEFRGFAKGRQYTLANGQVWEQVEDASLAGVRAQAPAVTIKPGVTNTWFLKIAGYNTAAKVRRIK